MKFRIFQKLIDKLRRKDSLIIRGKKCCRVSPRPCPAQIQKLFQKYPSLSKMINGKTVVFLSQVNAIPGVTEETFSILSELLANNPGANKLLNIGCGMKGQNDMLCDLGFDVFGVDIDIENDAEKFKHHDLNGMDDLPFPEKFFDYVVCQEVIEHIENPWLLFRKIKRVLKPEGFLVLTTPNTASFESKKIFVKNYKGYTLCFNEIEAWQHINPIAYFEVMHLSAYNDFSFEKLSGNAEFFEEFSFPPNASEDLKKFIQVDNNEVLHFVFKNKNNIIKPYIPSPTLNHKFG